MTEEPITAAMAERFWGVAAEKETLELQCCADCGFIRWPLAGVCPECLGRRSDWIPVIGRGTVWSVVVYHRSYSADNVPAVPYNVALVELDCGVRLLTRLIGEAADEIRPGERVGVAFRELPGAGRVPVFERISDRP